MIALRLADGPPLGKSAPSGGSKPKAQRGGFFQERPWPGAPGRPPRRYINLTKIL